VADFQRTYAIEMVDQIYERNGSDVPLEIALISGLGYENGYALAGAFGTV
jgi:hypothetical protein